MIVTLAVFIILIVILNIILRKNKSSQENTELKFWEREREANFSRRKDISDLPYLTISEEKIPQNLDTEAKKNLLAVCGKQMLNLSGITNTDLKLQYGAANLEQLSACDSRFSVFTQSASDYAKELADAGFQSEAKELLELAVSCEADNSSVYTQLAALYQADGNAAGLSSLTDAAGKLAEPQRTLIQNRLAPFLS